MPSSPDAEMRRSRAHLAITTRHHGPDAEVTEQARLAFDAARQRAKLLDAYDFVVRNADDLDESQRLQLLCSLGAPEGAG